MNYEKLRKLSDLRQQDELLAQARLEVQRQIDLAQMDLDIGSYLLNFDQNFGKKQIKFHTFIPLSILRVRRGGAHDSIKTYSMHR